jgi:hypothetical protein
MLKDFAIMDTELLDMVQLLSESQASVEMGEAFASYMLNPTVAWAKFVLTDDRKNANGQRVPVEEFDNLINSGIHMPVKMAMGEIDRGHKNSRPLGVITHLKKVEYPNGTHAVIALAALWNYERPSDVTYIRDRFKNNEPVNVSWEILYGDKSFNKATDSFDLRDTVLSAATIVDEPAYQGRTQFLAVAAKKWSKAFIEALPDSSFLYIDGGKRHIPLMDENGKVDRTRLTDAISELGKLNLPTKELKEKKAIILRMIERFEAGASVDVISKEFNPDLINNLEDTTLETIEELRVKLEEVQTKLNDAIQAASANTAALAEKDAALAVKDAEFASATEKLTNLETELATLRELKASIDADSAKKVKLEEVKNKFLEAGIAKEDSYFTDNAETLIALDENSITFMIQELKAFAESGSASASKEVKIPALVDEKDEINPNDGKSLGRALRESKKAKK